MQPKGAVFDGKTLDEAVRKGMEALGLSRAEVMITVLEEGSGGFLGIGARPYRVRMMPRPARQLSERPSGREREARGERGDRGGRDRRPGRGDGRPRRDRGTEARSSRPEGREAGRGRAESGDARPDRGVEVRREGRGPGRGRSESPPAGRPAAPAAEARQEEGTRASRTDEGEGRGRRRRRRGRPGDREMTPREDGAETRPMTSSVEAAGPVAVAAPRMTEERQPMDDRSPEGNGMSPADLERSACRVTEDLLRAMGFDATVTARVDEDTAEVRAEVPEQSDLLVGPKGEVRQALQHLLNRTLNRGGGSRYHLQLEINDFWQQREDELRAMALRLADEAVAEGAEKHTEYLNSQERRVVHMSLREHPAVTTHAIGDGLIKKIAITPGGEPEGPDSEE